MSRIPLYLKHKPVYSVEYAQTDKLNKLCGDAKFMSIGYAQWNEKEVSVKIFRQTDSGRWSRQSEELPLSRALDLAILIADTYKRTGLASKYFGKKIDKNFDPQNMYQYFEDNIELFNKQLEQLKEILNK